MKKILTASFAGLVALALTTGSSFGQTIISHWSFDSSTLTLDGGNITGASDSTGNHNAVNTQPTGGASGTQYTSQPFLSSASVTGQFGEALTFSGTGAGGNGTFMTFPNLTELMAGNGAPSYTVSLWLNTTITNSNNYTILSNWGNVNTAAPSQGRFPYGFGFDISGGNARMRAQTRYGDSTGDIFAQPVVTSTLNDGSWHMLTWTFDTTTGVLSSYFDGSLVNTFQSVAPSFQMIDSTSPVGSFGIKGDSGTFINGSIIFDEVWVVNGVLDADAIQQLYTNNVVVPEPATLALLGGGLIFLGARFRRRRA